MSTFARLMWHGQNYAIHSEEIQFEQLFPFGRSITIDQLMEYAERRAQEFRTLGDVYDLRVELYSDRCNPSWGIPRERFRG